MTETRSLTLVDGSGIIHRAFHATVPMTGPDGRPINAVHGFCGVLGRLLRDHTSSHIAVVFDHSRKTWRNALYPPYKQNRPPMMDELRSQLVLMREAVAVFGVAGVELDGWEADDLIASYAHTALMSGWETTIISSDKDMMQLIRPGVRMWCPIRHAEIDAAAVIAKFGVPPALMPDLQALMGDSVDNVPGVAGIGVKGAAALLAEYGSLERILMAARRDMKPGKRRDMLNLHAANALLSQQLVTLPTNAPLPLPIPAMKVRLPDYGYLVTWLAKHGLRSTIETMNLGSVEGGTDMTNAQVEGRLTYKALIA